MNAPAPNLVGDTPITPVTSPTVVNNEGPTPTVGANKEAGSGTQGLSSAQSEDLARNADQLSSVRAALSAQALAAQSRQMATSNTSPLVTAAENASGEADLITIVIRAPRLLTDAQGNSYEENAAGQVLVNLKDGGTVVLNAELSAAALSTMRLATIGSLVGDATLGVSASAGLGTLGGWIADGLAAVLKLPVEALVLMSIPGNAGQGSQITGLHNDTRFEQRPGELFGRLMARDPETNQWVVARDNLIKVETATGFAIISAEDAARLSGLLSLPLPALQHGGSPPLVISPISQGENNGSTSFPAASPVTPTTTTTPIPEQRTVEDLIVAASNAQNNEETARRRYAENPSLRDPSRLVGSSVSGLPGAVWGYPTDGTRSTERGTGYQEGQAGVPAGLEVNYRGVWYDGVITSADGKVTLIDYKDGYDGFLNSEGSGLADWVAKNPNVKIEADLVKQARNQVTAANGTSVEWRCSSQRFTDYLNGLFEDQKINGVNAVYTPKK
jgi:hypothetical protein